MSAARVIRAPVIVAVFVTAGCYDISGRRAVEARRDASTDSATTDDGPRPDAGSSADTGSGPDTGVELCRAMDAQINACSPGRGSGAFFDGDACLEHDGHCVGTECHAFRTRAECEAATARCKPMLCRATGGTWDRAACGDYECGVRPVCRAIVPGCNCGIDRMYREGVGCLHSPCGPPERCSATGGRWMLAGEGCSECVCGRACLSVCVPNVAAECQCGPFAEFDSMRGCVPRDCGDEGLERLCTSTGGDWGTHCTNLSCGEHPSLPCTSLACRCPSNAMYVTGRGCVAGGCPTCESTCAAPGICCTSGGGTRIPGPPVCVQPDCSSGQPLCPRGPILP